MRNSALRALFIYAALSCMGQASDQPYTFFRQSVGLLHRTRMSNIKSRGTSRDTNL